MPKTFPCKRSLRRPHVTSDQKLDKSLHSHLTMIVCSNPGADNVLLMLYYHCFRSSIYQDWFSDELKLTVLHVVLHTGRGGGRVGGGWGEGGERKGIEKSNERRGVREEEE